MDTTERPPPSVRTNTSSIPAFNITVTPEDLFPESLLVKPYILILTAISCCASIFGCCAIFWTFYKFPEFRTKSRKLLLYLTIADLFTAVGYLIGVIRFYAEYYVGVGGERDLDIVCVAQSFITTSSSLCSFFWMIIISVYFLEAVIRQNLEVAERMMLTSHVVCWGLPVLLTSIALGCNVLGEDLSYTSGGWCWIKEIGLDRDHKLFWMLFTGKFWEFGTYMVLIINYLLLKYFVWIRRRRQLTSWRLHNYRMPERYQLDPNDTMFIFVPIILLVLRIWGSLKFAIIISLPAEETSPKKLVVEWVEALTTLQGIGDSGQGFWNFVLFCLLTEDVRSTIRQSFRKPRMSRYDSIASNTSAPGSVNTQPETRPYSPLRQPSLTLSVTPAVLDEYNEERKKLYHQQFSRYDSCSLEQ